MEAVIEHSSATYKGTLLDADGNPVPASLLTRAELTLYDIKSNTIINGREAQDVLNTNGVAFNEDGTFIWAITPDDNAVLNQASKKTTEEHVALFLFEWPSGHLHHNVPISVTLMHRVPEA